MIKIWAKIYKENRIIGQCVYQSDEQMRYAEFNNHVYEVCQRLNLPSPVIIKTHILNYAKYNHVRFLPSDFIEGVDFDKLILENIDR